MRSQGDLVAHRAGHDEQACFVARKGGDVGFEVIGRGVFEDDIVEEGGVGYCVEHVGGGGGHCVGAEVEGGGAGLLPGVVFFVGGGIVVGLFDGVVLFEFVEGVGFVFDVGRHIGTDGGETSGCTQCGSSTEWQRFIMQCSRRQSNEYT